MVCPNCNKNISDNVIYCPLCGGVTGSIPKPTEPVTYDVGGYFNDNLIRFGMKQQFIGGNKYGM